MFHMDKRSRNTLIIVIIYTSYNTLIIIIVIIYTSYKNKRS